MNSSEGIPLEILRNLETLLRGYIRYRLSSADSNWWKQRVDGSIREDCERKKISDEKQWPWAPDITGHPIEYANFNDYIKIITNRKNWNEVFSNFLGDQTILSGLFKELEGPRNALAHNRPIPEDAIERFKQNARMLTRLIESDKDFIDFRDTHGSDWTKYSDLISEEDMILIVAGNPWLLGEVSYFKQRNAPVEKKKIDILFENDLGVKTYVEVKFSYIDHDQISEYTDLLRDDMKKGLSKLYWFIPSSLEIKVDKQVKLKIEKAGTKIVTYDTQFFTDWAYSRRNATMLLDGLHSYLSEPFEYTVGRVGHPTFTHKFTNVCDALYFYGYMEREGKKSKVGFHLATLGWYLDLLRNISDPNFNQRQTNPELVVRLALELLEYPYHYKDAKATPMQTYRPTEVVEPNGFIHHLANYRKKGRIDDIKKNLKEHHESISKIYHSVLIPLRSRIGQQYPISDRLFGLTREDILEGLARKVAKSKLQMDALPAGRFRDGIVDEMKLKDALVTDKIGYGNLVAENTRIEEKGTYKADMAKRIVEIMALKRIIDVHAYIVPTYEILVLVHGHPKLQRVQTFRLNEDVTLRRDLLGEKQ